MFHGVIIILLFTLEITKDKIYSRKVFISLLFAKLVKRFMLMTKLSLNFQTTVEKADPICDPLSRLFICGQATFT